MIPTTKPDHSPGINWARPITRGMVLSANWLAGDTPPANSVNRSAGTVGSAMVRTMSPYGLARTIPTNGGDYTTFDRWTGLSIDPRSCTIECVVRVREIYTVNAANIQAIWGLQTSPTFWRLGNGTAGQVSIQLGSGVQFGTSVSFAPWIGRFAHLALTGGDTGATANAYINGGLVASGVAGTTTITQLCLGVDDANNRSSLMDFLLFNAWARPLTQAEIRQRAHDWWGHLIRPDGRLPYLAPIAAPSADAPPWLLNHDLSGGLLTMGI